VTDGAAAAGTVTEATSSISVAANKVGIRFTQQ